jgi:hypothetical protein
MTSFVATVLYRPVLFMLLWLLKNLVLGLPATRQRAEWLILSSFKCFFLVRYYIIILIYLRTMIRAGPVTRHACSATSGRAVVILLLFDTTVCFQSGVS